MTRLVSAALGAAITVALGCAAHAQSFAVGGVVGTAGLGAEVQMKASSWLVLRGAADFAEGDRDETHGDIAYAGKLKLGTGGAFVDLHPGGKGFMLSGGAYFGQRRGELDGQPVTNVRIGGVSYTPAQVGRIDGDIKMSDVQPFVGVGYDSTFTRTSRIGLKAVLGMAFSDTPEVTLRASGGTLSTNAVFLENVRAEEADIAEDSKDFKYFPVAQVGLSYRF
jgi:hypothetical protein